MQVTNNALVAIRYRLRSSNGEILESIMERGPVQYIQGSGAVLPSLEAELTGMEAGDTKTIIMMEDGSNELYVDVVIDTVRPATEQEIQTNNFNQPYPGEYCGPDCIC